MKIKKTLLLLFSVFLLSCGGGSDSDNGYSGYAPIYAGVSNTYKITKYEYKVKNLTLEDLTSCLDLSNTKIKTTIGSNVLELIIKVTNVCPYNNVTNPLNMFEFGLTDLTAYSSDTLYVLMNTNPKYTGFSFGTSPLIITETLSNGDMLTIEATFESSP